MQKYRYPLSAM